MLKRPLKRAAIFICVALGVGAAAACTSASNNEVATIDKQSPTPAGEPTAQRKTAEALSRCLADAGVETFLDDYGEGDAYVRFAEGTPFGVSWAGGNWFGDSNGAEEGEFPGHNDVFDKVMASHKESQTPGLVWGELDMSEQFKGCLESSGYFDPKPTVDVAAEMKWATEQAEANTKWAQCARQNGFPTIADPPTPTQEEVLNSTWERNVIIPGRITADQLRALLEACPKVDLKQAEKCGKASKGWDWDAKPDGPKECEWVVGPSVWLDETAFGLEGEWFSDNPDSDEANEYRAILDVLMEQDIKASELMSPEG